MPVERREEALKQWNKARWLFPLKITFGVIKILCHYAFYTTVCASEQTTGSLPVHKYAEVQVFFPVTNTSETLEKSRFQTQIMLFHMG
jgi:hypothetical protein